MQKLQVKVLFKKDKKICVEKSYLKKSLFKNKAILKIYEKIVQSRS